MRFMIERLGSPNLLDFIFIQKLLKCCHIQRLSTINTSKYRLYNVLHLWNNHCRHVQTFPNVRHFIRVLQHRRHNLSCRRCRSKR